MTTTRSRIDRTTRLYRLTREQVKALRPNDYVFSVTERRRPMLVIEVRQHNWVLVLTDDGVQQMVAGVDLRQCKCERAGRHHWHAN